MPKIQVLKDDGTKPVFDKIFMGGLDNHRKRGQLCDINFIYETDSEYCHVIFEDGSGEICKLTNLKDAF